ncbi:GNAT family N-acetyltransferase [Brachybacterium hainanense]|uniref:GNAT family N-acetyltransferase n=1 Tax=Brachybacterium hainanense TaxID=1541174 RepID=A0ABV6REC5_9MICO
MSELCIRLVLPDPDRFDAWRDAVRDFAGTGMDGSGYAAGEALDPAPEDFAQYLAARAAEADETRPPAPGRVHCSYTWIVGEDWEGGGPLLGFAALRHRLNTFLLDQGGHIGYSVRPAARRRDVATAALRLLLEDAGARGIDPVLVTCLEENVGSRAVIDAAGGSCEDSRSGHRRFWFGGRPWPSRPDVP